MNPNPLSQYFRQPAIYLRLPSQGKFYPPGALDMPANGELPVLPMTTLDEITYRTPDALFNGAAVATVIQSCVPNIKDPWKIPSMDIDTILVSIRMATYGSSMEVETTCPKCETESEFGVDLRILLENIKAADYLSPLKDGDLEIFFRPIDYKTMNENSLAQFEDQKMLQMLDEGDVPAEQRSERLGQVLKKITAVTINALAASISMVRTPSAAVVDQEHIREWLSNCDRSLFSRIRDHIIDLKKTSEMAPLDIKCPNCSNEYQQAFTMNMTDFFEAAS